MSSYPDARRLALRDHARRRPVTRSPSAGSHVGGQQDDRVWQGRATVGSLAGLGAAILTAAARGLVPYLRPPDRKVLCVARDPGVRLNDIAATLGITERSVFGIVTDVTEAGYVGHAEGRP